jgi:uncharacterized protein
VPTQSLPRATWHRAATLLVLAGCLGVAALAAPARAEAPRPAAAGTGGAGITGASAPTAIDWSALRPDVPEEGDPFAALPEDLLEALRGLVKSRMLEARGFPVTDSVRQQRGEWARLFAANGVAVDELLARRDAIAAARRAAAEAGMPALDGTAVQMRGYLLPVATHGDRVTEFLLVPDIGACSHVQPPPPNQVVRLRVEPALPVPGLYAPAVVSGMLRLRPETRLVYLLDGERDIGSTYAIDAATVSVLSAAAAAW